MPKTTEPPVIWHAFHCDPVHEVVLVSRDKVHFRASAFRLGRVRLVMPLCRASISSC